MISSQFSSSEEDLHSGRVSLFFGKEEFSWRVFETRDNSRWLTTTYLASSDSYKRLRRISNSSPDTKLLVVKRAAAPRTVTNVRSGTVPQDLQ